MQDNTRPENNIRRRVMVIDDELINRKLLGNIVSRDYDVIYAENGKQAMELIKENEKTLSLILLDLLMPEMDGYELLNILHADAALKHIPVIVLTSEKSAEVDSLKLGAADFIPKPYDMPEVILARVQRSIELAEDNVIINETEKDELTQLYTKDFFFLYAKNHDRYFPGAKMDALVLDVNRFHLINEMYGRSYGDEVLIRISDHIKHFLYGTDGLACRSNDTFYIYISHREDYESVCEQIFEKLTVENGNTRLSIRLGIYADVDLTVDIDQRFDRANMACTSLRSTYQSSYAFYDTKLHEKELYSERLISDFDAAIEEKQFKAYFQPKYNIKGERAVLSSAEALVRWFHPELGMVSPGAFIPLFESNGLIQTLDRYIWREAAAQIKRWKDKYGLAVPVSVNVSRMDLYDPKLEEELLEIVASNGLKPDEYLLEITESAYTENSDQIIKTVTKLRQDGFRVEMDDFGSGYSSLNMLTKLPIDALKLDMYFIRNVCADNKNIRMIELMVDIAGFLNVPVIAEGVETKEQLDILKNAGCDIIQGYYFSKPVPESDFNELIEKELEEQIAEAKGTK